jgi:hypothetical protein
MNQYMLHSKFKEEERSFMYEDKFVPIFERMLEQNCLDEAKRLIEEEARKRKIKFERKWRKFAIVNRNSNHKKQ